MVEHRKGLNRLLFWLYSGAGKWPNAFRWSMLAFDLVTIGLFLIHPEISWHGGDNPTTMAWLVIDGFIASVITLDLLARFYIERHKHRFFLRLTNLADIVVASTMLVPFIAQNMVFLRVFRVVRLVRAFEFLDHQRMPGRWLHYNSFVVSKVVNLVVFVFIVAALVFVNQHGANEKIGNYLDALYFTVGTLTTTGFGDITMQGTLGRMLAIVMMVLGVTLFLQLIRAIAVGDKVRHACPACTLALHDKDAAHCKRCGANLYSEGDGPEGDMEALPRR
jgi:voltage-gated potassium channel